MKYHKQQILHRPEIGEYGDCMRTAVACLLNKEPEEVPHFLDGNADSHEFQKRIENYLSPLGLRLFAIPFTADTVQDLMDSIHHHNRGLIYLLSGESCRGVNHVVVCKGNRILHDPHPNNSGLIGPCQPGGYYWVEMIIPEECADMLQLRAELAQQIRDEIRREAKVEALREAAVQFMHGVRFELERMADELEGRVKG